MLGWLWLSGSNAPHIPSGYPRVSPIIALDQVPPSRQTERPWKCAQPQSRRPLHGGVKFDYAPSTWMNPTRFIGGYPPMIYTTFFSLPQRQVVFVVVSCYVRAFLSFLLKRLRVKINIFFPFIHLLYTLTSLFHSFSILFRIIYADMCIIRYNLLNIYNIWCSYNLLKRILMNIIKIFLINFYLMWIFKHLNSFWVTFL